MHLTLYVYMCIYAYKTFILLNSWLNLSNTISHPIYLAFSMKLTKTLAKTYKNDRIFEFQFMD